MSQISVGHAQKSSYAEEMQIEGIPAFTRDLGIEESMLSIDVRIHH